MLDGNVGQAGLAFSESSVTVDVRSEAPESFEYSNLIVRQGRHHLPFKRYPSALKWWTIIMSGLFGIGATAAGPVAGLASAGIWVGIPNTYYFAFTSSPGDRWLSLRSTSAEHRCAFLVLPRRKALRKALRAEFLLRLGDAASIPRNLGGGSKDRQTIAAVGSPAPEFSLADLNGRPQRLADYRGRVVILNFWAPWCGPCRTQPPSLKRLLRKYGESNLAVLGMVDEQPDQVRALFEELGISYPTLHDKDSATFSKYGVTSVPASVVIDRNGVIVARDSTTGFAERDAIANTLKVHALHRR